MTAIGPDERRELVALLRGISPGGTAAAPPAVRPDLEPLVDAVLPRRPLAILFDVYGTLLSSAAGGEPNRWSGDERGGEKARGMLERELAASGFASGPEAFAAEVSRRISEARRAALGRTPNPEVDIELIVSPLVPEAPPAAARRLAVLLEASRNPCAPMPGARLLLAGLAGGPRLGIVSNAQFYTPLLIEALLGDEPERLGLEPRISAYSYEKGVAKPDAEIFRRAAGPLLDSDVDPGEILVVGNSWANDIAPARALGFMTILFAGDERSFRPPPPGPSRTLPHSILRGFSGFGAILPD